MDSNGWQGFVSLSVWANKWGLNSADYWNGILSQSQRKRTINLLNWQLCFLSWIKTNRRREILSSLPLLSWLSDQISNMSSDKAPADSNPCFCHHQELLKKTSQIFDSKHHSFLTLPKPFRPGLIIMTQVWVFEVEPANRAHTSQSSSPLPRRQITFALRTRVRCTHTSA